jgi:hypothetical protein
VNKAPSIETIESVLDGAPVFRQVRDGPLFSAEELDRLAAAHASENLLLAVAFDDVQPFARRIAAIEALAQRGDFNWRASPDCIAVTSLLARAIPRDTIHNHWGMPGISVGRSGAILVESPDGVTEALAPLLDAESLITIVGSEAAAIQALHRYRIGDLAAWLLLKHRSEPWFDDVDPVKRDEHIARLRSRLKARG